MLFRWFFTVWPVTRSSREISNSLDAKRAAVKEALTAANAGLRQDAGNKLRAFMASFEAQRGKEISDAQADELAGWANRIRGVI
jgi:hypothetical protein